jgi:predicted glycoside hydrolase/deacetylase ChbG (UPF0249 family)
MTEAALRNHLDGHFYVMLHEPVRKVIDAMAAEPEADLPPMPMPQPVAGVPTLRDMLEAAAVAHGLRLQEAMSPRRNNSCVFARWVYAALAVEEGHTLTAVQGLLGGNHTTALHAVRTVERKHPKYHLMRARAVAYLSSKFPEWEKRAAA